MPRGGPRECGLSRPCMTLVTTSAAGLPPRASHAYAESRMPPTMRWLAWLVRLTIAPVFLGALLMLAHSPTSVHNVAASLGLTVLGAVHVFYWWHPWPNRLRRTVVATVGMVATNFFLLNLLGLAQPLLWLYPALIVGAGGDELVPRPLAARPDVAVVDIEMPGQDGISAASELRQSLPSCRTLMLTMYGRPGYVQRAMEVGIS